MYSIKMDTYACNYVQVRFFENRNLTKINFNSISVNDYI